MKKELIILVYKINIAGLTRQQAEQSMVQLTKEYSFEEDSELQENYIFRNIWLPITEGNSDVKVIFPVPTESKNVELEQLVQEITAKIEQNPDSVLSKSWDKLVRELKLSKLNNII